MTESDPRRLPQILYIEDSEESRSLVRRLLSRKYIVLEAAEPLSGLQLAEETHPSLILLDHNLPHMSGREAATRLRQILPDTPLVIVSADSTNNARERALAAGAAGFIAKPINPDTFEDEVEAFLSGKREKLEQAEKYLEVYQQELVERLEGNIRQLTQALERNKYLLSQNQTMFAMLERRHKLLETAARVGQVVTSILDLDELLERAVNIICAEFDLYYSGVFLVSDDGQWAILRAGYGEAGQRLLNDKHRLPIKENSMIGKSILMRQAQIALNVAEDKSRFENPYLPKTRSEIALPLTVESRALGALTAQSEALNAFNEEDIASLQAMADQFAIAISNAQLMQKLETANAEILRTKTFEAIATATGEAIHWVGNKAAPIPASAGRVREDLARLLALTCLGAENDRLTATLQNVREEAERSGISLKNIAEELSSISAERLKNLINIESTFEDLQIIEKSAQTILNIKEDLIGPARQRRDEPVKLRPMLATMIANMGLPHGVVTLECDDDLEIFCDARQTEQVFNNLVKNAWEALANSNAPVIEVKARRDDNSGYALISVRDNGHGIPKEIQEKIWVSFFTTKGGSGGTGLGLSACMQIVNQNRGRIWLESEPGNGATFFVSLPTGSNAK